MNDYLKKEFYNDLTIISNDNVTLYYSKYSLTLISDYFIKLLNFNNVIKDEITLDLQAKTITLLLHWSDKRVLNINDICIENLIELWDFSNEILALNLRAYINLFIINNFIKVIEQYDIVLVFIKSYLYMPSFNADLIKSLCIEKIDLFTKSPEIQNLTANQVGFICKTWNIFIAMLKVWTPFADNINKISEIGLDCSKLPKAALVQLKNIYASSEDKLFLKQMGLAAIDQIQDDE